MNKQLWRWTGILRKLGHRNWAVEVTTSPGGDGYCWHGSKTITIGRRSRACTALFLHEVAHIALPGHDALWADHFTSLVDRFMGRRKLPENGRTINPCRGCDNPRTCFGFCAMACARKIIGKRLPKLKKGGTGT